MLCCILECHDHYYHHYLTMVFVYVVSSVDFLVRSRDTTLLAENIVNKSRCFIHPSRFSTLIRGFQHSANAKTTRACSLVVRS